MSNLVGSQKILQQLGGQQFIVMVGAKNLIGGNEPIRLYFKIGRGAKNNITHVRITLNSRDFYDIEFLRIRGIKAPVVVSSHSDVHAEDLCRVFTSETGFDTRL